MTDEAPKREPYTTPSPSALALVDMCEARAGARYIEGLKEPEGMKAALGTRCHAIAAEYLLKGTAPNRAETFEIPNQRNKGAKPTVFYPGRIVWNILTHLPPAGTVPNVEKKISLEWGGIKFHERSSIDWENDLGYGDHKFTTDVGYAKSIVQLRTDAQRIIYAADWFQRHDTDKTVGQWTYGQFDCKASKKVLVPAFREEIAELMSEVIVPKAEKLLGWVAKGVDWRELPKNTNECGTYKPFGCPYARECPRTASERRQMIGHALGFTGASNNKQTRTDGVSMSSFMEKLRAKKAAAVGAASPANDVAPSAYIAPVSPSVDVPSNDIEHDAEDAAAAIVGAINPPGEAGDVRDAPDDSDEEQPVANALHEQEPVEEPKKQGRGRPKGVKNKPKTTLEHQLEVSVAANEIEELEHEQPGGSPAREPLMTQAELTTRAPASADKPITMLLVDCFIARSHGLLEETIYASDLIAQAHAHIKNTYHVLDYRAGGAPELEFGKGPGLLAACIEGLIQDLPRGCVVIVDTRSPEGAIALQPLVAASISVIRGAA